MKSTISTILGTAALGLMKEKLGSPSRLYQKDVSVLFSENRFLIYYDGIPFKEDVTIISSVPGITDIKLFFVFDEGGQTVHDLMIVFDELYTDNQIYQIIKDNASTIMLEAWSAFRTIYNNSGENPGWSYLYADNAVRYEIDNIHVLRDDLVDPLIDNSSFFRNNEINRMKRIINADTGEIYEPKKTKSSKLRKR